MLRTALVQVQTTMQIAMGFRNSSSFWRAIAFSEFFWLLFPLCEIQVSDSNQGIQIQIGVWNQILVLNLKILNPNLSLESNVRLKFQAR